MLQDLVGMDNVEAGSGERKVVRVPRDEGNIGHALGGSVLAGLVHDVGDGRAP